MLKIHVNRKYSLVVDIVIIILLGLLMYGVVSFGHEWTNKFHPTTVIDLSATALPLYALFSTIRASVAYLLSLGFSLIVGYCAAKFIWAEKVIIPCLDILQSIPVLGFLPGLVFGFVALFPNTNTGLELAAIVMIFTGQVWNMTFSFYSSIKSIPPELLEASSIMGMSVYKRFIKLELPFSAVNLAWNSLMSMAGGWFFLSVCEAFTLGEREFRLPGIGAYMATAISQGDNIAMMLGVFAMVVIIITMDFVVWRPVLAWVHKFRLEEVPGGAVSEPFIKLMLKQSYIYKIMKFLAHKCGRLLQKITSKINTHMFRPVGGARKSSITKAPSGKIMERSLAGFFILVVSFFTLFLLWQMVKLVQIYLTLSLEVWLQILMAALFTLMRVLVTLVLSSLWAVPVGIYIGMSEKRVKLAQPIVQVLASFPAPMLYPLALALFFHLGMSFHIGSMFLMMLGVQWYVLFNVLAGAMRIPQELLYMTNLLQVSNYKRWFTLYIPCVFPALVTGWVTAAGGAWNASIVAEFVSYRGQTLKTPGIGATISVAAAEADFPLLLASLSVMVVMVIILNRTVWAKLYKLSTTRFRMDT